MNIQICTKPAIDDILSSIYVNSRNGKVYLRRDTIKEVPYIIDSHDLYVETVRYRVGVFGEIGDTFHLGSTEQDERLSVEYHVPYYAGLIGGDDFSKLENRRVCAISINNLESDLSLIGIDSPNSFKNNISFRTRKFLLGDDIKNLRSVPLSKRKNVLNKRAQLLEDLLSSNGGEYHTIIGTEDVNVPYEVCLFKPEILIERLKKRSHLKQD